MAALDAPPAPPAHAPAPDPEPTTPSPALARPAEPRPARPRRQGVDAAGVLIGLGRTCIVLGLLIFGFVGYELLGTNIAEARHQDTLREDVRGVLGEGVADGPLVREVAGSQPIAGAVAPPPAPEGKAVAVIKIPRIGLEKAVVEGVELSTLKRGPGHYPGTPLPGQPGNSAIAGHRTTYGSPFFRLDELRAQDPIFVTTAQGAFRYEVKEVEVVKPTDVEVVGPTDGARLTLTTCHPRFSARQRLIVHADLVGPAAAPPPPVQVPVGQVPELATGRTPVEVVGAVADPAARTPTIQWGAAAAAVALLGHLLGRRWRRLPAYALVAVPFGVSLFFFYANLARLIPS